MDNSQNYVKSTLRNGLPYDIKQTPEIPKLLNSPFDKEIKPDIRPDEKSIKVNKQISVHTVFSSFGTKSWEIDIKTVANPKYVVSPWNNSTVVLDKDLDDKLKCL